MKKKDFIEKLISPLWFGMVDNSDATMHLKEDKLFNEIDFLNKFKKEEPDNIYNNTHIIPPNEDIDDIFEDIKELVLDELEDRVPVLLWFYHVDFKISREDINEAAFW